MRLLTNFSVRYRTMNLHRLNVLRHCHMNQQRVRVSNGRRGHKKTRHGGRVHAASMDFMPEFIRDFHSWRPCRSVGGDVAERRTAASSLPRYPPVRAGRSACQCPVVPEAGGVVPAGAVASAGAGGVVVSAGGVVVVSAGVAGAAGAAGSVTAGAGAVAGAAVSAAGVVFSVLLHADRLKAVMAASRIEYFMVCPL